jgi:ribosomal protein S12 methylthiotransferase accessory factor
MNPEPLSVHRLPDVELCPLSEGKERAKRLINEKSGIISKIEFGKIEAGEPKVFFAKSSPANLFPLCGQHAKNYGDAVSIDPDRAIMKSIGESIERYCSAQYDASAFAFGKSSQLNVRTIDPEKIALFSQAQYSRPDNPFSPLTPDTSLAWTRGYSIIQELTVFVPAQLVYVPYTFTDGGEPPIHNPISTGLACSSNVTTAACKGIYEVIERDAFMIVWKNQLPCPQLDLNSVTDPLAIKLLNALEDVPVIFEARVANLDMDVHVIVFIIRSATDTPPYTVMGLGADLNPEKALISALEEAFLTFLGMRRYIQSQPDYKPEPGYKDITTPAQHAVAHAMDLDLKSSLDFLIAENSTIPISDLPDKSSRSSLQNVKTLVSMMKEKDLDIILFDLTTSDVNEAGFKVVRATIPGMQPLDISHSLRYLGGTRLYQLPVQLGLLEKPNTEFTLNPYPHPFP